MSTPDIAYLRGVSEALAEVGRRIAETWPSVKLEDLRIMLRDAAAELGLDEGTPETALSATETPERPRRGVPGTPTAHPHAYAAVVAELNRRPEFDGIRDEMLATARKLFIDGDTAHPLAAERTREDT